MNFLQENRHWPCSWAQCHNQVTLVGELYQLHQLLGLQLERQYLQCILVALMLQYVVQYQRLVLQYVAQYQRLVLQYVVRYQRLALQHCQVPIHQLLLVLLLQVLHHLALQDLLRLALQQALFVLHLHLLA